MNPASRLHSLLWEFRKFKKNPAPQLRVAIAEIFSIKDPKSLEVFRAYVSVINLTIDVEERWSGQTEPEVSLVFQRCGKGKIEVVRIAEPEETQNKLFFRLRLGLNYGYRLWWLIVNGEASKRAQTPDVPPERLPRRAVRWFGGRRALHQIGSS